MIKQKENESRALYLSRVLLALMEETAAGEFTIEYDDAECDGLCLAKEIENELIEYDALLDQQDMDDINARAEMEQEEYFRDEYS